MTRPATWDMAPGEICVYCCGRFQDVPADPLYPLCRVCIRGGTTLIFPDASPAEAPRESWWLRVARWQVRS